MLHVTDSPHNAESELEPAARASAPPGPDWALSRSKFLVRPLSKVKDKWYMFLLPPVAVVKVHTKKTFFLGGRGGRGFSKPEYTST